MGIQPGGNRFAAMCSHALLTSHDHELEPMRSVLHQCIIEFALNSSFMETKIETAY